MNDMKRYMPVVYPSHKPFGDPKVIMEEYPTGGYVRYVDHERHIKELESALTKEITSTAIAEVKLEEANAETTEVKAMYNQRIEELEADNAKMAQRIEELEHTCRGLWFFPTDSD